MDWPERYRRLISMTTCDLCRSSTAKAEALWVEKGHYCKSCIVKLEQDGYVRAIPGKQRSFEPTQAGLERVPEVFVVGRCYASGSAIYKDQIDKGATESLCLWCIRELQEEVWERNRLQEELDAEAASYGKAEAETAGTPERQRRLEELEEIKERIAMVSRFLPDPFKGISPHPPVKELEDL